MIGQSIAHYRIVEKLGQGAMGVVYRAEDTRLGRQVAIKALFPRFTTSEQHRLRFEREARAAAGLAHPGIAAVYALEQVEDQLYIVSELVRGETLRATLKRGPVPIEELIPLALYIARALATAHANGVVHRDLKPENIIRTGAGEAKILDFGLAQIISPATSLQTAVTRLTEVGMIVGTVGYMSPEQVEGRPVDARSDIFAFGTLIYELVTGRHPFEGTSAASTIAHLLSQEPPSLADINPLVPTALARIVRKCLRKRPEERYQSTREVVDDLEQLATGSREPMSEEPRDQRRTASILFYRHALFTPRWWWEFHQVWVIGWQLPFVYASWLATKAMQDAWALPFFFAVLILALLIGNLRGHLLFTASFNPSAIVEELRRVTPWLRSLDVLFMLVLLAGAWRISASQTGLAVVLVGMGIGQVVASVVFEPPTSRAAFREHGGSQRF